MMSPYVAPGIDLVNFDSIVDFMCDQCDVNKRLVLGDGRKRPEVFARQLSIYVLRRKTKKSYTEICAMFNRSNHTTGMHSYNTICGYIDVKDEQTIYILTEAAKRFGFIFKGKATERPRSL